MILLTTTEAVTQELSVWGMILKGGWLMIPIFILSLIAVYIFFERYLLLVKYGKENSTFMDKLQNTMFAKDFQGAIALCSEENTPMARTLGKGLYYIHLPITELRAIIESKANLEVTEMEKGLSTLATCSGMAPMIGFLGTVVGMIQAFYDMALAGSNINITLLSRGIYTAMITTVAGLIVGIIAHFAYNAITARIDKIVNQMESNQADFMEVVYELKNKK
jgi:biopolymer transport protein ExbB